VHSLAAALCWFVIVAIHLHCKSRLLRSNELAYGNGALRNSIAQRTNAVRLSHITCSARCDCCGLVSWRTTMLLWC
jgi:hypothetical protein